MRNYFKSLKTNSGFTLIELLVVIGILGILAAALIATIDPFEQLRKANDANVKNTAVEFVDANIRYYTTHNVLPWSNTNAPLACQGSPVLSAQMSGPQMLACLGGPGIANTIIGDGELKSGFTTVTSILSSILVTGSSNAVTACFQPASKSQQADANTKYSATGTITSGCISQGGTISSCYWCSE